MTMTDKHGSGGGRAGNRAYDLDDINDAITHTPRDQELLVPADDREGGPYTAYVRVPKTEVEAKCRAGFRRITGGEEDMMLGEVEDYTADWKHSD
jgi:hypothetical protein